MQTGLDPRRFFAAAFRDITGYAPFRWQERLFLDCFLTGDLPAALDLPTGLGKTSVMAVWYLAWAAGAAVPRRLVYVVDRRAVVDQATAEAEKIKRRYEGLRISTLRGQHTDNREWLEDPALPAIIVGTVDMIGSRLLFSGYGVSRKMRPYHAGLLGADTLVVLDESHLVPPFEELMKAIAGGRAALGPRDVLDREIVPPFRLLSLSATGRNHDGVVFRLQDEDHAEDIVRQRLEAKKRTKLLSASAKKLDAALADAAWDLAEQTGWPIRCLVYCNSREVAEQVCDALAKRGKKEVETELFVGGRRVRERKAAADRLEKLGFLAGSTVERKTHGFVIATSAGEVGIDLDADHMICDLVPWERMVQRLGRVNRRGEGDARIVVVHQGEPKPAKPDEPRPDEVRAAIAWRSLALLQALPGDEGGRDASPAALAALKTRCAAAVAAAATPEPLRPALTRALVEAWSMTALEHHTGRPEIGPWLRGWIDEEPQTTLLWRAHLPVRTIGGAASEREVAGFFEAAPPHLTETLEAETWRVVDWLIARAVALSERPKGGDGPGAPFQFKENDIVAMALDAAGKFHRSYRLQDLHPRGDDKKHKQTLERTIRDLTLVVDARFGGLGATGLLDSARDGPVSAADGEAPWPEVEVGFRIAEVAAAAEPGARDRRRKPFYFAAERSAEGEDIRLLLVEKTGAEPKSEEDRALSGRPQRLAEHQQWTARKAHALARALDLRPDLADALEIAARLHDEGKQARLWQRAFNAPADGPYAKTGGPVNQALLGGYRHEFGSLFHAGKDEAFKALPEDLQDLVLHLIAAHHGHARPIIATEGCEEAPPSALQATARDVALRFARLQKRWGPWGLAWLEALLRAADQQASRDNDQREPGNG